MSALRISAVTVTPVAFADPPLLNSVGVHEPFALRAVVEVSTDGGLSGLGETYADERHLAALYAAADVIVGADAYHTEQIYRRVQAIAAPDTPIASDLLGGAVRDEVPFSAYLFYKWAAHPGAEPDGWGEALDPGGIVAQARRMVGQYGFTALKLKGGVFPPDQEAEAIRALRLAFPDHPLRLDPNAAWTEDTSVAVARDLDGVLEYLEDPTAGIDGMARVARLAPMPLATNMCVVAFAHLPPAAATGAGPADADAPAARVVALTAAAAAPSEAMTILIRAIVVPSCNKMKQIRNLFCSVANQCAPRLSTAGGAQSGR